MKNIIQKRPLPELPSRLPELPDNLVYVGDGPFDWMEEAQFYVKPFFGDRGVDWNLPLGYYWSGVPRALPKDSPLLKKYFILPETSTNDLTSAPKSPTITTMKAKITLKTAENINLPVGYTAFQIKEQVGIPADCSYTAKNGVRVGSWASPEYVAPSQTFYLRGRNKNNNMDNIIIVVSDKEYKKIVGAINEYVEHLNKPTILYTATFFYRNEKNGAKKRRLVDVQKEDGEYIEGIDKDVTDGVPFRRFLKKNIIGDIAPVK